VDGVVGLEVGDGGGAEGGVEVVDGGAGAEGGGDGGAVGVVVGLGGRVEHRERPAAAPAAEGHVVEEGGVTDGVVEEDGADERPVGADAEEVASERARDRGRAEEVAAGDRKSTRLNSSHVKISYAVFCLQK